MAALGLLLEFCEAIAPEMQMSEHLDVAWGAITCVRQFHVRPVCGDAIDHTAPCFVLCCPFAESAVQAFSVHQPVSAPLIGLNGDVISGRIRVAPACGTLAAIGQVFDAIFEVRLQLRN